MSLGLEHQIAHLETNQIFVEVNFPQTTHTFTFRASRFGYVSSHISSNFLHNFVSYFDMNN